MKILSEAAAERRSRRRRRRLKTLSVVPTLLTLGNLTCGFSAICFGLRAMHDLGAGVDPAIVPNLPGARLELMFPSLLSVGAGLIILGMVFDGFDGLVARATRSTTDFGGQLDSLADVVTCGVAPAILMVAFMSQQLAGDLIHPSPFSEHWLGRVTWLAAAIYVAFAAIRLARFNVEHAKADFDHSSFHGLPSPGAAGILAALIIFQDQMGEMARAATVYVMPVAALIVAFLMVSRFPYRRFHRTYLVGDRPFGQVMTLMVVFAVFWVYKAPMLLLLVVWYSLSGPLEWIVHRIRKRSGRVRDGSGHQEADAGRRTA